ncbi:hypothetical protein FSARC_5840 [Fusarium sarcochroum]|uniref:Uncharacterized protein n=1 Tax=Fusarium sarcochroum TaxID=1208366 RepID=A0A8H4XA13_9HYPO|nr:hypothetical protein FSARC_5840 [Fusarium sarcochroum]
MSLHTAPRTVASNALYRSLRCLSFAVQQPRFPTRTCAFSTTTPSNRQVKIPNPNDFKSSDGKPVKMRLKLQSDSPFDLPPEMEARAEAAIAALDREARLRGARVYRAKKITDEHRKMAEILQKEDYDRRYKQAERNWVKFMSQSADGEMSDRDGVEL